MADITLCATKDCPAEMQCARKLIKPKEFHQSWSYFDFKVLPDGTIKCEHFRRGAIG